MERESEARRRLWLLRDEIKQCVDYQFFYKHYCINARFSGTHLHAHCPILAHAHSGRGSPSFSVDLHRGLFHCFSRNEGGDCIRFYQLMHNASFSRAVRELARELGISSTRQPSLAFYAAPDREEQNQTSVEPLDHERMRVVCEAFLDTCRREDQTEGISYLVKRGIDRRTIEQAGVVYFPRRAYRRVMRRMIDSFALDELQQSGLFNKQTHLTFYRHRLLFPFYVEGRAVYLQARTTAANVQPRWHNMRGGVPALYNVDALNKLATGAVVYLVEGFTDTLTLVEHGFPAVGLVGAGGFREEWLGLLGRFRVVAALDGDRAGHQAAARYEAMFAARSLQLTRLCLASDINDFFRHLPSAALEFALMTEAALEEGDSRPKAMDD